MMQWLTHSLDLCGSYSWDSTPPSCRSKFLYWVYDDPTTNQSPDKIFVYGGIPGDVSWDCACHFAPFAESSEFWWYVCSIELTFFDLYFGVRSECGA